MGSQDVSVVDDDESVRQALAALLRSAGFRVTTFVSAEEFLGSPHVGATGCLILDLRLPGMSGLELQQRLVSAGRRFPIVILTAHGDDAARSRALAAGATAFMPKPFDGEALLSTVQSALKTT
jgi:FixJ family two-component response regulator